MATNLDYDLLKYLRNLGFQTTVMEKILTHCPLKTKFEKEKESPMIIDLTQMKNWQLNVLLILLTVGSNFNTIEPLENVKCSVDDSRTTGKYSSTICHYNFRKSMGGVDNFWLFRW